MKKKLVEVNNLESFICQANAALYADNSLILTPGAKDELARRNITIVRDKEPFATCGGREACPVQACDPAMQVEAASDSVEEDERLLLGIAAMVKEEFGIEDPKQLYDMSKQFVQVLQNLRD